MGGTIGARSLMTPHDARYVAAAFALMLVMTAWGLWPYRLAALDWLADRLCRFACRCWGHEWRFVERTDVGGERWAIYASCGERRMGW